MKLVREERVTDGLNMFLEGDNHQSCLIHISIAHFANDRSTLKSPPSFAASCDIVFHYNLVTGFKTHRKITHLHFLMPDGIQRLRRGDDLTLLDDLWVKYLGVAR